jgi:hypothetical protein
METSKDSKLPKQKVSVLMSLIMISELHSILLLLLVTQRLLSGSLKMELLSKSIDSVVLPCMMLSETTMIKLLNTCKITELQAMLNLIPKELNKWIKFSS